MGLFDALTGGAASDAAKQNRQIISGVSQMASGNAVNAQNSFLTGQQQAGDDLRTFFPQAFGQLTSSYDQARRDIGLGVNEGRNYLTSGHDSAVARLAPWATSGQAASSTLMDALGLNGPGGAASATAAFQAGPGYTWQRDQAIDGYARNAAKLGMAAGGNTATGVAKLGSDLANQSWGSWLDRLSGVSGQGLSASGTLSGLDTSYGSGMAGLITGYGNKAADLATGYGTASAGNLTGLGSALGNLDYNTNAGIANVQTGLTDDQINLAKMGTDNNNTLAASKSAASGNFLNLLMGGAKLATGLFG